MSQIHFKFRAAKDYSSIVFDGLSISVFDLKQEILREKRLDPEEYGLVITNAQTNEDYADDSALIPKSTSVLVRRVPYTGPKLSHNFHSSSGVSNTQQQQQQQQQPSTNNRSLPSGYSNDRGHNPNANAAPSQYGYRGPQGIGMAWNSGAGGSSKPGSGALSDQGAQDELVRNPDVISDAEDARIAAMLQQTDEQWSHQQSIMEMQRPVHTYRPGGYRPRPRIERPEHQGPPPPNYICHRCGVSGHWIHSCPTIGQPGEGGNKSAGHRIKRTTGIPKSFLQKVDKLEEGTNALVTSDGTLVVATANEDAWNEVQKLSTNVLSTEIVVDPTLVPDELKCNICQQLVRDAVRVPCCQTVFCSECVEQALLSPGDHHFTCPACKTKDVVPDQLVVANDVRQKVDDFMREYSASRRAGEDNKGQTASSASAAVSAPSSSGGVVRPPVQMVPQPRRPQQQQQMGMMPGMMMGMNQRFPGMVMPMGMPMGMGMGQLPYMPPGMMPPPGMMMPPQQPHPNMSGAQWNASMRPPMAGMPMMPPMARPNMPASQNDQQQAQPQPQDDSRSSRSRSDSNSVGDRSMSSSPSGSRRSSKQYDDFIDMGSEPVPEQEPRDGDEGEAKKDGNDESEGYQPPPQDDRDGSYKSSRHRSASRSKDRSRSRERDRSRRRDESRDRRSYSRSERHHSRSRDYGRSSGRERDGDGDRERDSEDGRRSRRRDDDDYRDSRSSRYSSSRRHDERHGRDDSKSRRRDNREDRRSRRSRSPERRRPSRERAAKPGSNGRKSGEREADSKGSSQISIRGRSTVTADDSKKQRSILDRISDTRSTKPSDEKDGRNAAVGGSNKKRRRRRR